MDRFKSVNKAISVLKCFNPQNLELSASEISKKVGMHRVTSHRLLETFLKARLLEKNDNTGKYRIGPELYILGNLYLNSMDALKTAEPVIKTLNELTNEAVNVGILDGGNLIVIMKEESRSAFRISVRIGTNIPAYSSAMGKALLSELNEAEVDGLYPDEPLQPLTAKTISTKTELKRGLEEIRKTVVSFSREEAFDEVVGISSIIRGADGQALAAISISVPIFRMNQETSDRFSTLIRMAASLISYRLGYKDVNNPVHNIMKIRTWWENVETDPSR